MKYRQIQILLKLLILQIRFETLSEAVFCLYWCSSQRLPGGRLRNTDTEFDDVFVDSVRQIKI